MKRAALLVLFLAAASTGQDRPEKPKRVWPEDALTRAVKTAHAFDDKMARTTVVRSAGAFVAVVEYDDGGLGIFQGDEDPKSDAFITIDSDRIDCFDEAVCRAKSRIRARKQ